MKINWKARMHNKAFIISFATIIITFIYQLLSLFGIVPKITQNTTITIITLIVDFLAGIGVVVDGTTKGICDSERAMTYYCKVEEEKCSKSKK